MFIKRDIMISGISSSSYQNKLR